MIQRNQGRKAQISIEFLFALGIILLLFLILFSFWFGKNVEVKKTGDYLDKKNECSRVASLLSSAFIGGDGTKIKVSSIYYITIYNNSVGIRFLKDLERNQTRIAILVSEAGMSSQSFYDAATADLNPVWYKACFSDLGSGSGCEKWQSNGIEVATWNSIPKTIDNLMADLDLYNVIYLEDAHIRYNAVYNGKTYVQLLDDWVKKGNILIFAEHIMCREQNSETYDNTSYRCNPPGNYNSDVWDILGIKLYEEDGSYGNNITVVVEPDHTFFPNMQINDNFVFEEPSYVEDVTNNTKVAIGGKLNGTYSDSGGSYSNTANNDNSYWYVGSNNDNYNITGYAELDYNISNLGISNINDISQLDFTITYCHDGSSSEAATCDGDAGEGTVKGTQDVEIYNFSSEKWVDIGNLRTNDNGWEVTDTYSSTGKVTNYINGSNMTRVRYKIAYYDNSNEDTFLTIDESLLRVSFSGSGIQDFVAIGKYQNGRAGIASWKIGGGKAFYFADFQVLSSQQTEYSQILLDIIQSANDLFISPMDYEVICPYSSNVITLGNFSNKLLIENKKSEVYVTPA